MTTRKEAKMLEKVLNLPGVIIKGYQKIEGVGWTFRVESERLAYNILEQLKRSNIKSISESQNVSEGEIERMLEDVQEEINNKEIKEVEKLGIDEIALKKGKHNYCAVLVNLEIRKPLSILEKRTKEVLKKRIDNLGRRIAKKYQRSQH